MSGISDGTMECFRGGPYSETPGAVSGGGPAPPAVEAETLVGNDFEEASAAEGFRVGLAFDFEDIEGKKDNFSDADQTGGEYV